MVGRAAARAVRDPEIADRVRGALDTAHHMGMETMLLHEPGYPPRLLHLADPPPVLFLRGRRELLATPGIAVVGARRSTERARRAAHRLSAAVAAAGAPVVSGLALGVDGAAHEGALDARGPTVAVLGRGADRAYPRSHAPLFRRILSQGLVVSEFLPGTPPLPHHFPRRNRILAALSRAVVVVEAGARSGALITVEHGLDLGLDVWAMPGPFGESWCAGSNALLADGARALVSIRGFLRDALGVDDVEDAPVGGEIRDGEAGRILGALTDGGHTVDEIARATGLTSARTLTLLSGLELDGWVERTPGMRFRRAS
jgi:DNA processing protein